MGEATFDTSDGVSVNVLLDTVGGWSGVGGGGGEPLEVSLTDGVSVNVLLETVGGWSGGGGGGGEPLEVFLTDELLDLELDLLELELLVVVDVTAAVAVSPVGAVVMEEVGADDDSSECDSE